ncbi:DUF2513 domain-containing protein [Acetobacterium fimetarium]|uniref:DUF2513 domain-containing protein n=1 Tax=Acetobacterium fimetarium TaxID=52691 RepID=A0ABR6WTW6_9FIRM|nr:DUF2513 domain-containing protein [Acetobacterium fimetarium]MBC3803996.1 DUF2513 domain-containing protein [Acetobacterium fimetarium]
MKRDMELIREILLTVEEKYVDTWLHNNEIQIDGYDMKIIGYHCAILHDAGMIYDYEGQYGDGELLQFGVGRLTWEDHEFLDKIKSDTVWNKTKDTINAKGIPFVLDAVKEIATAVTTAMIKTAILGL